VKILLTGPTGFIGRAFTREALARGHEVAGLVIPSEPIPADAPAGAQTHWFRGTLDEAPWKEIEQFGADVCLHTAWVTTPGVYLESPENYRFLENSIAFARNLRERGLNHLVVLGTCIEYQVTGQKLSEETTPIAPTTTYSRCKNDLRIALEADARKHGFVFGWGRVFYPYGPGEHPSRLCSSIIQKLSQGEKLVLKTPNSTKDYIFIEDLADVLVTVLEKRFNGTINLGTGVPVSVKEIARMLGQMLQRPELIEEASPSVSDPLDYVVAEAARLHSLGWKPRHDMAAGLKRLLEAIRG
jgi:nucleoside-diphosphate-sugar epimerase